MARNCFGADPAAVAAVVAFALLLSAALMDVIEGWLRVCTVKRSLGSYFNRLQPGDCGDAFSSKAAIPWFASTSSRGASGNEEGAGSSGGDGEDDEELTGCARSTASDEKGAASDAVLDDVDVDGDSEFALWRRASMNAFRASSSGDCPSGVVSVPPKAIGTFSAPT